jgi:soluble lytic murein transglycosylase-like protein
MRPFTENLLPNAAARGWGIRSAGIVWLAWLALAAPAAAGDPSPPIIAALPPPNLHLDTTTAVPHPLSAADADRYEAIFRLQQRGDWQGADALIGQLGDRLLMGHVLAQRYLHPTAYRSAYPELRDWLEAYADLPEAQQIYRLAGARRQKGDAAPREPAAVIRRLGTPDSGGEPTEPNWEAGLAAWRVRAMAEAGRQFEIVANDEGASTWARAAGAFWAARAHLKNHEPGLVSKWMRVAAGYPRTFYGQLARRALGMNSGLAWSKPAQDDAAMRALAQTAGGVRALALLQVGMSDLAEDELHMLLKADNRAELAPAVMLIAQRAGLPAVSIRLAVHFEKASSPLRDAALYPVPNWKPEGGFTLDPALLFALMRQESGFNPRAQSPAGASGLMQLMPATATALAADLQIVGEAKLALFDPVLNLTLAQRYVSKLLKDPNVKGDLMMLAIAYNAGPGNLAKYRANASYEKDPLLFIESIPGLETRQFIERVLTNYWLYQDSMGEKRATLDALASGGWPIYSAPPATATEQTAAVPNGTY